MTVAGGGPAASSSTWVPVPDGSDFPIDNLPFGIVQPVRRLPRPALRIGDHVVDLSTLAAAGLLEVPAGAVLHHSSLNPLMASGLGPVIRREVAALLQRPPEGGIEDALVPIEDVDVLLPIAVGDYVDFYSSIHHAGNLGRMMRPGADPILPNWRHLPVAYHGRGGTVRASGVDVVRPEGLVPDADGVPRLRPTASLDIGHQIEVQMLLQHLNADQGVTMVLSTHDLNLAAALCRRLVLLKEGRVLASGPTEDVLTPETVRALYNVEADVARHAATGHLTVVPIRRS